MGLLCVSRVFEGIFFIVFQEHLKDDSWEYKVLHGGFKCISIVCQGYSKGICSFKEVPSVLCF